MKKPFLILSFIVFAGTSSIGLSYDHHGDYNGYHDSYRHYDYRQYHYEYPAIPQPPKTP